MTHEIDLLEQSIATLESQRGILGDSVVDTAVAPMREKLMALRTQQQQEQHRKLVTVLFADVSGFTALSETLDPEDISNLMNRLWQRLDTIILAHGGHIDKHLGDGVMALWGTDTAREDDPERAVRAALEMLAHLNHESDTTGSLKMRVGINTGGVLLGSLGTQGEYTAVGDTVNVAARLEKAAPIGKVIISADTYRHVRGVFDTEAMPPLEVKGKSEPLQTYIVHGLRPRAFRLGSRGVEGIETHMIGRDREMALLTAGLERAARRAPLQLITLIGDAGIGKSRLLYEVERWNDTYPAEFWVFQARADQQRQEQAMSLARDLFFYRFEIQETDSPGLARQKLENGIIALLGEDGRETAHLIGQLLGFDFTQSPYLAFLRNDPRTLRARAFDAILYFFSRLAESDPLLFLIEDLHWADDSSLNLINHLFETGTHLPVITIATARPSFLERLPAWRESHPQRTLLFLEPLSENDSRLLVREILQKVSNLPLDLQETIVANADGNPFYLEELIKMLIENGGILKEQDTWRVDEKKLNELSVPPTLIGVLQARLDRLQSAERAVLQRASVIGRTFWDEAITYIETKEGLSNPRVESALGSLAHKELIYGRTQSSFAGAHEYLFRHALLRDVVYEQVLKTQRRLYHHQAALWLIEKSGERAQEYAGVIAEHFDRAGEAEEAINWYLRAGQSARETFVFEAALDSLGRVLQLTENLARDPRRISAQEGLANILYQLARLQEAAQQYHDMLFSANEVGDLRAQLRALHGLALVNELKGDYAAVMESVSLSEERYAHLQPPDLAELAQISLEKARALYYQGKYAAAKPSAERGLEAALAANAQIPTARLYNILGMIFIVEGQYERAIEYKMNSLEYWRAVGSQVYEAAMLNNIGENYRVMGENEQAISFYEQSLKIAQKVRDVGQRIVCLNNMGGAYVAMGAYKQAIRVLEEALRSSQESVFTEAESLMFLAEAYLGEERTAEAIETIRAALAKSGAEANSFSGNIWRVFGLACAQANVVLAPSQESLERLDARQCFERALAIEQQNGVLRNQALILWDWAYYEKQRGENLRAVELANRASSLLQQLNLPRLLSKFRQTMEN